MSRVMNKLSRQALCVLCMLVFAWSAAAQPNEFSFGVIAYSFKAGPDESILRAAIAETDADNLANGIKSAAEPCTDAMYNRRKNLLDSAKNGLILSLAGSDWSQCINTNGRSAALERLNRLRDLFFVDEFSSGASRIPVVRQSTAAKFRSYAENARWEVGNIMFATVNLPADNNHYRAEAGRNSEFEDRLVANRDWLQRVFTIAAHRKLVGIVLFSDGNPLAKPDGSQLFSFGAKRDGFAEARRHISALAAKFPGKVLVVHGQAANQRSDAGGIVWRGNLGEVGVGSGWMKLTVDPGTSALFNARSEAVETNASHE
jgi:hypothetical protein